ncbi:MAG TPA: CBS and ACT domain-containing protein [Bacillota bacterium]|nr:CBS and ACT domain-containing protein [Bacillota bacterium]
MFVKNRMTVNPVTVEENIPVLEATELMRKYQVHRLPVMHGDRLVGIVTERDLLKVSPSSATTLSVYELNYLLSKLKVSEAMAKNPITVTPDTTLEEAALIMRDREIGGLPVVEDGKLLGIITETDVFDAFLDLMGLRKTGTRLTIDFEDRIGVIAEITEVIKQFGVNIISMAFHANGAAEVVLRLDLKEPDALVKALQDKGYKIVHVATW